MAKPSPGIKVIARPRPKQLILLGKTEFINDLRQPQELRPTSYRGQEFWVGNKGQVYLDPSGKTPAERVQRGKSVQVRFRSHGDIKRVKVMELVMRSWRPELLEVPGYLCHRNGLWQDNRAENLMKAKTRKLALLQSLGKGSGKRV